MSISRREQLRILADRFIEFVNTPDIEIDKIHGFLSPDLTTPLNYPGAPSGFIGVKGIIEKLHDALSEYSLTVLTSVVDEEDCRVACFVKSSGIQTGEWRGFPGSGRRFDHYGFIMMKIDLSKKLIVEIHMLFQETLFLKQIGVIPYGMV